MAPYVPNFITGLRCEVEELSLIPKGQMLRISAITPSGSEIKPQDSTHDIYKVFMENGETWAADITGAQYGHRQVLYRWDDYRRERCERITKQRHFGYLRQAPESFFQSPKRKTLVEAIDNQISFRTKLYEGQLNSVLKGSDARFQAASQEFLQQFETDVLASLEKISKSSHPLTKEPEVIAKLSRNLLVCDIAANQVKEIRDLATYPGKEVESAGRLYTIRAIAGKGKGLVAMTKIVKGSRILSEAPIFILPRDNADIKELETIVANEVKGLDKDQQRTFFDLTNIYGDSHSQSLGIARTNVLPLGSNARSGGLFLESSRTNHSCRHNAQNTWNESIGCLTIHALRDIEEGQEFTISYLASTPEYAERQRSLREKFKFDCNCELCSLPPPQREESDIRLRKLEAIDSTIGMFFYDDADLEPDAALNLLYTMFSLFDEEGIWDARIARAYNDAYQIAVEGEDEARARIFAERGYNARRLIEGDDSPVTLKMKRRAEEISAQIPQGMSEAQFEIWLWMLKEGSADAKHSADWSDTSSFDSCDSEDIWRHLLDSLSV